MCSSYLPSEVPSTCSLIHSLTATQSEHPSPGASSPELEDLISSRFSKLVQAASRQLSQGHDSSWGQERGPPCKVTWSPPLHSEWVLREMKWKLPGLFRFRPSIWSPSAIGQKYPRRNWDSKGKGIPCQLPQAVITNCHQESSFSP